MAVALQADLAMATWGTMKAMRNLIKSASIDDVQPHTVTAMASLGSLMNIDSRLLSPAAEALGGNKSVKMESIKFLIGFNSGGIASEIRNSSMAIKTFLLITALSTTLQARETSELLMELLIQSKILEEAVVSPAQLTKLIQSLEGNSHAMLDEGHMSNDVLEPIKAIAAKERTNARGYFVPLDPSALADLLLEVFEAIRDEAVGRIRISGCSGAATIVTVLVWLFPHAVEVRSVDETVLLHCRESQAKVIVVLDYKGTRGPWKKDVWHTMKPSTLLQGSLPSGEKLPSSESQPYITYDNVQRRAPCSLLYSLWSTLSDYDDLSTVANWSLALVTAVLRTSRLERDNTCDWSLPQSLPFRDICSNEFRTSFLHFPVLLGCPKASIDPELIQRLGERFTENEFEFEEGGTWWTEGTKAWFQTIVNDMMGRDRASTFLISGQVWNFATVIADLALSSATRTDLTESVVTLPLCSEPSKEYEPMVLQLLGKGRKIKASAFMQRALLTAHGPDTRSPTSSLIAISGSGRVSYLTALLQPPLEVRDAFHISVKSGQMRWRNANIRCLYDEHLRFVPFPATNPARFTVDSTTDSHPAILRVRDYRPFQYFLANGPEDDSAQLVCEREFHTDSRSVFTKSLINWSTAMRCKSSKRSPQDSYVLLEKAGVAGLQLKHPACAALHCFFGLLDESTRAVATYNEKEQLQFLEFGTHDTCELHCIVQGQASLLDCIAQALKVYGEGWVIMSNPSSGLSEHRISYI